MRPIIISLALVVLTYSPHAGHGAQSTRLQEILPRFEAYAAEAMDQWEVPGMAVAVVEGDAVVFIKGYGVREFGQDQPVGEDTLFQIGSITKSFTSLLVGMEVDAGKLAFIDQVIDHLPTFRTSDPWVTREFTIEDLMAHRSGLPTTGGDLQVMFGNTRQQVIDNIRHIPPVTSFRTRFAYQNNFFLVASAVAEKLSGRPFTQDVANRLFVPLGMKRSKATSKEYLSATNAVAQHQRIDGKIKILPKDWPYQFAVDTFAPAGAISSTARDMAAYMSLHMNRGMYKGKQLVSEKTMLHLHSPKILIEHVNLGRRLYYCQGVMLDNYNGRTLIWHNGGTPGGKSVMMYDADAKVGIVILSNMQGTMLPDMLALAFFDMYFDFPFQGRSGKAAKAMNKGNHDTTPPKQPDSPAPARKPEAYAGSFANPICGSVRVFIEGGKLKATLGNVAMIHELRHHDGDTFWLPLPMVDVDAGGFARFEFDPQGKAIRLTLDAFSENAIGSFDRIETN